MLSEHIEDGVWTTVGCPMKYKCNFHDLNGEGVKVAIIDSGIDCSHEMLQQVTAGICFELSAGNVLTSEDYRDTSGHGTAVASIIKKKAPDTELYAIKIFDQSLIVEQKILVESIRWAIDQNVDIINLSLGTTDVQVKQDLLDICKVATKKGIVIVAAEHNSAQESYPAYFPNVIGVKAGEIKGRYNYLFRRGESIECIAPGTTQRVLWAGGREHIVEGSSFAAPHITGIIALIRQAFPKANLNEIRHILEVNANREVQQEISPGRKIRLHTPQTPQSFDLNNIKRAAIYPYNKEMHSLVRFRELLNFEIVGIADPIAKGYVGKDAGEAIGIPPVDIRIQPRFQEILKEADTLILGYVDELSRITKKNVLRESIEKAIDANLNVFSFLSVYQKDLRDLIEKARKKNLWIYSPDIHQNDLLKALQSHDYPAVDVPVIGVFGTSAQQGKFTVQLVLKSKLIKEGYKVGQIGTEHHSQLFGMDVAFPTGYASPLQFPIQLHAPYLDFKMREVCANKKPDLMLVGAQSGSIPYDVQEPGNHTLTTLAFMLGTKPDANILVVNSVDDGEYIRDTMNTLKAITKGPVLCLAMSDKEKHIRAAYGRTLISPRQMSKEEIRKKLAYLENRFEIPAVEIVSEEGQQRMVDLIISYFANEQQGGDV